MARSLTKFNFDCVFYYVTSLKGSISFYSDVLGLRLTSSGAVARFDIDGVLFELVPDPDKLQMRGHNNARLCLKVLDIDQAVKELTKSGVHASGIRKVENGKIASFDDPDGNEICLWQHD